MVWTGTFFNGTPELFRGVEGYFAVLGSGNINPPVVTPTRVELTSVNFLGQIIFTGNNLTVGSTTVIDGIAIPVFTGGTITGIEYRHNYRLQEAIDAGIPSQDTTALALPELLEPSAELSLPNVSASALSDAVVQSYSTPAPPLSLPAPLLQFFSQDSHVYTGTDGVNLLAGYDGNDTLIGLSGNDRLSGNEGDDFLDGGDGTDGLEGGLGNDFFLPGSSNFSNAVPVGDVVSDNGTDPNEIDTVSYENAPDSVGIDLTDGQGFGWARGLSAGGIEAFIGSNFNDTLIGSTFGAEILIGGNGDDTLSGLDGSDTLQGGPGFDELIGGLDGALGLAGPGDVARFAANSSQLEVFFFNDGSVFVAAPGGDLDRLSEIEFIETNDGLFQINQFTPSSSQLFSGDDNVNSLAGTPGSDLIFGRGGEDTLIGADGADNLNGGNGLDVLEGGLGADTLSGEAGSDTFTGSLAELNGDVIADFTAEDVLLVQNANFTEDSLTITQGSAILDIDEDLDGTVDSRITLQGDFSDTDFIVEPVIVEDSTNTSITINESNVSEISISDISLEEDNIEFNFTVTLNEASDETITVDYATADDSAIAGEDYIAVSGTLQFAPQETEKTITVQVNEDREFEENETFNVELSNPSDNAKLSNERGEATITNDDSNGDSNDNSNDDSNGDSNGNSNIELFRFRNTSFDTGTYVFVGEAERDSILNDENLSSTFALDGVAEDETINPAFTASTEDRDGLIPFYRLESLAVLGTFLFVSTAEYDAIFAEESNQKDQWKKQGFDGTDDTIDIPEFYLLDSSADMGIQFNRFQNLQNNTFLYAGEAETEAIANNPNLTDLFVNQGAAFESFV